MVSTGESPLGRVVRAVRGDGVHVRRPAGRWATVLAVALVVPLAGCAKEGRTESTVPPAAASTTGSARASTPVGTATSTSDSSASRTSPSASVAPAPAIVGDRVTARRAGLSFDVPDGWRAIDPALAMSGGASALPDSFRSLAEQSGQTPDEFLRRIGSLMDVLVMGPAHRGFADNVSVIPTPVSLPSPEEMRDQLKMAGAAVASVDRVSTPLGAALLAKSRITLGTKVLASRSIAVELDGRLTYITVSTSDWGTADAIADRILRTLGRA